MLNWLKKLFPGQPQPTKSAAVVQRPTLDVPNASEAELESILELKPQAAQWVLPGEAITIADYTLSHGMIYVGDVLSGVSEHVGIEPCLISPHLKVDPDQPDHNGHWMTHWPSYSEIPSACRAAYLEWQAGGRREPKIAIGYVFLFLYGLERRVLHDLRHTPEDSTAELTQIMTEVERLMVLYDHSDSFLRDAANFIETCWILQSPQGLAKRTPPEGNIPLQLTLGKLALANQPLPANWALAWMLSMTKVSSSISQCLPELRSLFRLQYQAQFGDGVIVDGSGPTVCLTHTYQPASVSFGGPIQITAELPEFTPSTNHIEALQPLLTNCFDALAPYGRWLNRNSEERGSYSAVLLLPQEIAASHERTEVTQFRRWATGCLSEHEFKIVSVEELFQQWVTTPLDKLGKTEATTLAQFLEAQDIGIEPDVRFGGKPPKLAQNIVLFRLLHGAVTEPSLSYSTAQLLLHLSAMIVMASDNLDLAGMAHVQQYLSWTPRLLDSERDRLLAHFQWLCHNKLTLRGLKLRLTNLAGEKKVAIAQFLTSVAKARDEVHPAAIDVLSKLYPLLGFEANQVHSQLHNPDPSALEAAIAPVNFPVPEQSPQPVAVPLADLNLDLIQRRQDESQAASSILADIFVEPEISEPIAPPTYLGLDEAHSTLLTSLSKQSQWHREELEKIATELDLLLDGALENINEMAFEQCDDALIEGDDPMEVNRDVLDELLAA